MEKREKIQYSLVFLSDLVSIFISTLLAWLLLDGGLGVIPLYERGEQLQFLALLGAAFFCAFLGANHADGLTKRGWRWELGYCIVSNLILAAGLATLLLLTKAGMMDSRYLFIGIIGINTVVQFAARQCLKRYLNKYFYKGSFASLVCIVATADRAETLVKALKGDWTRKLQGIALLDGNAETTEIDEVPVVAGFEDFIEWIRREPLDEVYVSVPYCTGDSLQPYVAEMESMGLTVHINIHSLEQYTAKQSRESWMPTVQRTLEETGGVPFATIAATGHNFGDIVIKRIIDVVGALVGLAIAVPIIAVTAIPLKLESPGPLFFKQKRVGRNGRVFYIYKLRSMYADAEQRKKDLMGKNKMEGLMFKVDDDPRITKVGRFIRRTSIDELPQFFNVLRGDMSLVGTRPPTLDEYEQYESHHKRRLSMKPGITGLWQVSGRSSIKNFEEVVKLDVTYIDNWSLLLDAKIMIKTIRVVFSQKSAQ